MRIIQLRNNLKRKAAVLGILLLLSQATILAEGFLAKTPVRTIGGFTDIDKLKVGDLVVSYDFKNKVVVTQPVTKIHKNTVKKFCKITCNNTDILVDEHHKFFCPLTEKVKWVKAKDLKVGDYILNDICRNVAISDIQLVNTNADIYNISVKGTPFFFITTNNVLVHNFIPFFIGLGAIGGFEFFVSVTFFGGLLGGLCGIALDSHKVKLGSGISVGIGSAGWGSNMLYKKWTNGEAKDEASSNGWKPDGKDAHNNPAFKDPKSGKRYAPDMTQHGAKKWKVIDRKGKVLGSVDGNLNPV